MFGRKKKELGITATRLCIFEDKSVTQFEPLHWFHPFWDLMIGVTPVVEHISRQFSNLALTVSCREELASIIPPPAESAINALDPGEYLFINARVATYASLSELFPETGTECIYGTDDVIVAARLHLAERYDGDALKLLEERAKQLPRHEAGIRLYQHLWELVNDNAKQITEDAELFEFGKNQGTMYPTSFLIHPKLVYLAPGSVVGPGVVLDASDGPIIIDRDAEIMANSFIKGPAYIGEQSLIKAGAIIYHGTSIGHTCKIGGEVEQSIILPFSNKQHHGFLGHAYIGSWCNLGAGTTNSDLKNTYAEVKVQFGEKLVETGTQFVGLFMGDHVKSGINTSYTTGTVVGPVSSVFGPGFQPKYLPPFSWNDTADTWEEYRPRNAVQVMQRVMKRRDRSLSEAENIYVLEVYKRTQHLRQTQTRRR